MNAKVLTCTASILALFWGAGFSTAHAASSATKNSAASESNAAEQVVLTFSAKVTKLSLPQGETVSSLKTGDPVSGELILSASPDREGCAYNEHFAVTEWSGDKSGLKLSGAVSTEFSPILVRHSQQSNQVTVGYDKNACESPLGLAEGVCKVDGIALKVLTPDGSEVNYYPQYSGIAIDNWQKQTMAFSEVIAALGKGTNENELASRLILTYGESKEDSSLIRVFMEIDEYLISNLHQ